MKTTRAPVTTHVIDLGLGAPATGLGIILERESSAGKWKVLGRSRTGADGRAEDLLPSGKKAAPGIYRLTFATAPYFRKRREEVFYPSITVTFRLSNANRHHHIPLLLNAFGYSTYRGT